MSKSSIWLCNLRHSNGKTTPVVINAIDLQHLKGIFEPSAVAHEKGYLQILPCQFRVTSICMLKERVNLPVGIRFKRHEYHTEGDECYRKYREGECPYHICAIDSRTGDFYA